jgi:hypothetical protein
MLTNPRDKVILSGLSACMQRQDVCLCTKRAGVPLRSPLLSPRMSGGCEEKRHVCDFGHVSATSKRTLRKFVVRTSLGNVCLQTNFDTDTANPSFDSGVKPDRRGGEEKVKTEVCVSHRYANFGRQLPRHEAATSFTKARLVVASGSAWCRMQYCAVSR